jgi:capsular polysaccharide biosynthesis protein
MVAEVSAATVRSAPSPIRVVDPASPPASPSWPKTKVLLLAALIAGLGFGLAVAVIRSAMQGWVSRSRIAKSPGSPPLYAVVGQDGEFARKLFKK